MRVGNIGRQLSCEGFVVSMSESSAGRAVLIQMQFVSFWGWGALTCASPAVASAATAAHVLVWGEAVQVSICARRL
jgi:hypothetical protein